MTRGGAAAEDDDAIDDDDDGSSDLIIAQRPIYPYFVIVRILIRIGS